VLHFQVIELPSIRPNFLGQPLAFLRVAKAFADFFAEVLEHGFPIQPGADWVSQPPTAGSVPLPVMATNLSLPGGTKSHSPDSTAKFPRNQVGVQRPDPPLLEVNWRGRVAPPAF
jgi:hypothetical protein